MKLAEFMQLMERQERCPDTLPKALKALWYDKKGDWSKAHRIVQDANDTNSAWVHAYIHRKEGDSSNASYWYRRSGRSESKEGLHQEWEQIAKELLSSLPSEA